MLVPGWSLHPPALLLPELEQRVQSVPGTWEVLSEIPCHSFARDASTACSRALAGIT